MPLTITPKDIPGFKLEDKRFHIPYIFESPCPSCGKTISHDMSGDHSLAYPKLGYNKCGFYCDDCERDWSEVFVLGLIVTAP